MAKKKPSPTTIQAAGLTWTRWPAYGRADAEPTDLGFFDIGIERVEVRRSTFELLATDLADQEAELQRLRVEDQGNQYLLAEAANAPCPSCAELQGQLEQIEVERNSFQAQIAALREALYRMQLASTQAMKLPLVERRLLMERSAKELAEEGGGE